MKRGLDYIYYRLYQFYYKWDGKSAITAAIGVSMVQLMIPADIITFIVKLFFNRETTSPYAKAIAYIGAAIFVGLIFYNQAQYKKKISEVLSLWSSETKRQRYRRGWLVLLALVLPWVVLILVGQT